jgi:hypothetical protein
MWTVWVLGALGIWMAISPFVTGSGPGALWNNWIVGLAVTNVALLMSSDVRWERVVGTAAGIWLFVSGFIPRMLTGRASTMNSETLAIVLLVAAIGAGVHYYRFGYVPPDPVG